MASPYFQKLNLALHDYSAIGRSGQAVAKMYESMGNALGQIGSAYFERKQMEDFAEDYVKSDEAVKLWSKKGLNPFDLQEAREDPKKARKLMGDIISQSGGVEAFKDRMEDQQKLQMAEETHAQQQQIYDQTIKQNNFQISALEEKQFEMDQVNELFSQAFKRGDDGQFSFDTKNIKPNDENAYLLPQVYQRAKDMKLMGSFNYSKWKTDLIGNGVWDASDRQGMGMLLGQTMSIHNDISAEDQRRYQELIKGETYEAGAISAEAQKWWNSTPNAKTWMQAEETTSMLKSALTTAIGTKPSGEQYVQNSSSASLAVRQFARLANGAGVMTDKDVSSVAGATDYESVLSRLAQRFLGEERLATQEDVDRGMADRVGETINTNYGSNASLQDLQDIQKAMVFLEEKNTEKLRQHGEGLQSYLSETFTGVPEERLLALSPFSQYWHRDHNFTINQADLPSAHRLLKTQGVDAFISQVKQNNPNIKDAQLAKIVSQVSGYVAPDQNSSVDPPVVDPRNEIDESSRTKVGANTDSNKVVDSAISSVAKGAGSGFVHKWMKRNYNRGSYIESLDEPSSRYREAKKAFNKAPVKELREYAKEMRINPDDYKSEKALRKRLREKFDNEIKDKVKDFVKKKFATKSLMKKVASYIATSSTGVGIAVAGASFIYDMYDLSETSREVSEEELNKMKKKYADGSEEAKIIDQMIKELSPKYRLSQGNDPYLQQEEIGGYGFPLSP